MKISFLIILLASTFAVSAQSDFTGKWKLNVDKSEFNNTPGTPAAPKLLVEQKSGVISYQRNDRPKETLKINGAVGITISEGENKTVVTMKTADDKKRLIETRTYTYPESEEADVAVKKTRTWSLSDDKKTLTIRDEIESTAGKLYNMVLIYDRQ